VQDSQSDNEGYRMAMTTEQLWEDFHAPLRQFIRTQVRDEQQTDDLLQDVFLKIHTHLDAVRTQDKDRKLALSSRSPYRYRLLSDASG